MSNYIDYRDLADSVHKHIQLRAPSFRWFKYCVDPMAVKPTNFPAVITYWENTETTDIQFNAQRVDLRRRVTMVSLIRVKSGDTDKAFETLQGLLIELKVAMIGYQPVISDAYNIWPIYPINEEFFEISGGELGIVIIWAVDMQEIAEVDSELYVP